MNTVLIQPAGPRDQAMRKDQYEALRAALEALGYSATVDIGLEKRSLGRAVADLAIHVGEDAVALGVVHLVKQYLRGFPRQPSGEPRTATIYGAGGKVLATVELEDDDSAKVVGPEG
jgi:hypothetical protein